MNQTPHTSLKQLQHEDRHGDIPVLFKTRIVGTMTMSTRGRCGGHYHLLLIFREVNSEYWLINRPGLPLSKDSPLVYLAMATTTPTSLGSARVQVNRDGDGNGILNLSSNPYLLGTVTDVLASEEYQG